MYITESDNEWRGHHKMADTIFFLRKICSYLFEFLLFFLTICIIISYFQILFSVIIISYLQIL
jgi:hypothetical protein